MRAHLDTLVALALAAAYLVETRVADTIPPGPPVIAGPRPEPDLVTAVVTLFLLSLAVRQSAPLLPLLLAFPALSLSGRGEFDAVLALTLGLALTAYSVGAWSGGRSAQVGALGVGLLIGLGVLRVGDLPLEPRAVAGPGFVLLGSWLLGLAARSLRVARHDERVTDDLDWEQRSYSPDAAARDELVRELRDIVERAMSAVILQARQARRLHDSDPRGADQALAAVEAAGTEALEETQRLTGLLLTPDGAAIAGDLPGLADVDYLAEEVIKAGLPVDTRVEGRPLPLTADLDAVAYRVVHEALMATLHGATDAHSSVVIRYEPEELQIEVTDDGLAAGDGAAEETVGLVEARAEVARLGGTLDAGPGQDRGYWVLARLPYEPDWS